MPVHAQSVIPTWVQTWDTDLYTKLTDQENWCYTGPTDGRPDDTFTNWNPLFTNLATAMNGWKNANRQSALTDFIPIAYSYNVLNFLYGNGDGLNAAINANTLFTMNGFVSIAKARATNYYDDIDIDPLPATSAKLAVDIALVNGGAAAETGTLGSTKGSMQGTIMGHMMKALFEDPEMVGPFPGKDGMADHFFNTLGYKKVYQNLNVGSLTLPPSVV